MYLVIVIFIGICVDIRLIRIIFLWVFGWNVELYSCLVFYNLFFVKLGIFFFFLKNFIKNDSLI